MKRISSWLRDGWAHHFPVHSPLPTTRLSSLLLRMYNSHTVPQWSNPVAAQTAWPMGMAIRWPYPGMPFPPSYVMQPPPLQPQRVQQPQPTEKRQLTELQPVQPLPPLIHVPPMPIQCEAPPDIEYETEVLLPSSSSSCDDNNLPFVPPTVPELEMTQENRMVGKKRKRAVGGEGGKESCDDMEIVFSSVAVPPIKREKTDGEDEETNSCIIHPHVFTSNGTTEFCKVVSHLSVIGWRRVYSVSINEIIRRWCPPEGFTLCAISSLLRRGKLAGCGKELQSLLESRGLSPTTQIIVNRRISPYTTMSLFLEEEAIQFSKDHRYLIKEHFPFTPLVRLIVNDFADTTQLAIASTKVKDARSAMVDCMGVLSKWLGDGWESSIDRILASPFHHFALTTHGLGVQECLNLGSVLLHFIQTFDYECAMHVERVRRALADANGGRQTPIPTEFPKGIEKPEIPDGYVRVPESKERGYAPTSFTQIRGRLDMLSHKRYNIKMAEILRRIRDPECLNLSILGTILRRNKAKGNVESLRLELEEKAPIKISMGRRKEGKLTTFTALSEGEALALAADMNEEMRRTFPFSPLAEALVANCPIDDIDKKKKTFEQASEVIFSLLNVVGAMQLPVGERIPQQIHPRAYLILNYSSYTHGYGPDAVLSWFDNFRKLFDIAAQKLGEKSKK